MGAAAAVEFLASLAGGENRRERLRAAFAAVRVRGAKLVQQLWDELGAIEGVKLYGPPPSSPRTPTVAFTLRDVSSTEVARRLARHGIFSSHGDFYAQTVIERLGLSEEGLVRAGCACYTNAEEVSRLIEAVQAIVRGE